ARSISSNPKRNGLDNVGTRDIPKSSRSDFEGPLRHPMQPMSLLPAGHDRIWGRFAEGSSASEIRNNRPQPSQNEVILGALASGEPATEGLGRGMPVPPSSPEGAGCLSRPACGRRP